MNPEDNQPSTPQQNNVPIGEQPVQTIDPQSAQSQPMPVTPQVQPTPQMSQNFTSPTPMGGQSPFPTSTPKNKAKMFVAIAVAILVLLGGGYAYMAMGSVSKDDYVAANSTLDTMRNLYGEIGSQYISTYDTETEIANKLDTLKKSKAKFDEEYAVLKDSKAIKKDSDLKAAFEKIDAKKAKFDETIVTIVEVYEKLLPAVSSFTKDSSSDVDAAANALSTLKKSLDSTSSSLSSQINKDFVSKMVELLTEAEKLLPTIKAGQEDYTKYDSATVNRFYDISSDITDATNDWSSNIDKFISDNEVRDEFNTLNDLTFDKAY